MSHSPAKKCIAVIPSIEGWYLLERLLPTIDLPKSQILVIDQGSRDDTEKKCLELGIGCIQLHTRASFTEAVNRGIKEALDRGADYVLIVNNDVVFETNVATQLLKRAEAETNLGVLAPRQIIVQSGEDLHDVKRVCWQLTEMNFSHECGVSAEHPELLEADSCEFTCVLISRAVFGTVGLLDEKYQFYHEDADFCFRCHIAGFRCAYDQTAVIKHVYGSTFNQQKTFSKEKLIQRNKGYFASDHLKWHIRFPSIPSSVMACSWSTTNEFLGSYLNKYGLVRSSFDAPTLSHITHPNDASSFDYLLTVWETTRIPSSWVDPSKPFKQIFVPSRWNKQVFENSGLTNVSVLPFGVETDLFNPWGPRLPFHWKKSILYVCQNQHRKALDVTRRMWDQIRLRHPDTFLILYGHGIEAAGVSQAHCFSWQMGNFIATIDPKQQTVVLRPSFKNHVSHADMAILYRSCDIYLLNSRSEGFGYPVLEAMACGCVCVIPNYGATQEFIQNENCFFFEGIPTPADYSDKGFRNVGEWWEPDLADLCLNVERALDLEASAANAMGNRARQTVLSTFTWRHSMATLRKELQRLQAPSVHKAKKNPSKRVSLWMTSTGHGCTKAGASLGDKFLRAGRVLGRSGFKGLAGKIVRRLIPKPKV